MSSDKKLVSPYKQVKKRNNDFCGYRSIGSLTPNKAYRIYKIVHTCHEKYGDGELAFIEAADKVKSRVQLPSKYLKDLSDEQIKVWYNDVERKHFPFLIYRETLPDKSFKINVIEYSPEVVEMHNKWEDVPEMDDSITSEPDMEDWLQDQKKKEDSDKAEAETQTSGSKRHGTDEDDDDQTGSDKLKKNKLTE